MIEITFLQFILLVFAFMVFIMIIVDRICKCIENKYKFLTYSSALLNEKTEKQMEE